VSTVRFPSILAIVALATACTDAGSAPSKATKAASTPPAPAAVAAPAALPAPEPSARPTKMEYAMPLAPLKQPDLNFSLYRNRWTLVYYFSPTCGHCQHGWPWVQKMRASYESKGLAVVAIASGSASPDDLQMFDTDFKLDVPAFQDKMRSFQNAYGAGSVPMIMLVKPDASFQTWVGSSDSLKNVIETLVKSGLHIK
jgi:thiol-disulfide isomerase/thioredoxin